MKKLIFVSMVVLFSISLYASDYKEINFVEADNLNVVKATKVSITGYISESVYDDGLFYPEGSCNTAIKNVYDIYIMQKKSQITNPNFEGKRIRLFVKNTVDRAKLIDWQNKTTKIKFSGTIVTYTCTPVGFNYTVKVYYLFVDKCVSVLF